MAVMRWMRNYQERGKFGNFLLPLIWPLFCLSLSEKQVSSDVTAFAVNEGLRFS